MLAAVASTAAAQDVVRIFGRVVEEESGTPIPGVDLTIRGSEGRFIRSAVTDDVGSFEVLVQNVDAVKIYASRLGYMDNTTPVLHFDGHDFYQVEIRLDPEALLLAPLEVIARSEATQSPLLANFRQRLASGSGYYITRTDVEQRNPMHVTDLLRDIPGVNLQSSGRGSQRTVRMSRASSRDCPVQVYVDGFLLTRSIPTSTGWSAETFTIDDVVSPSSIEGIEVYRGPSTVPPEFLGPGASCGVIAIWTRRGDR